MKGISSRLNKNGFTIISVHYTANPDKDEKWLKSEKKGMPPDQWQREYELNWLVGEGSPVYPRFNKKIHVAALKFSRKYEVIRGWDFGRRRPACIWMQDNRDLGQIHVLCEFLGKDLHFSQFMQEVSKISREKFPNALFIDCIDPYGGLQRGDKSQFSNLQMMVAYGLRPLCKRESRSTRLPHVQKIEKLLDPSFNNSIPGIVFDKSCYLIIAAMNGGLVLDKNEKPKKDQKYEDVHDALCYAVDHVKDLFWWDEKPKQQQVKRFSPLGRPIY